MSALAIRSRRIVLPDAVVAGTVIVGEQGKVTEITTAPSVAVDEQIDCGDLVISPGLVDCHVHVNEPGRTDWEGYRTATAAAAAGGVTSLVDMPLNCIPATTDVDALRLKIAACESQLYVDLGFWGGVVPGNHDALAALAQEGVLGCKAFLIDSGVEEFPAVTAADLRRALPILKAHGLPLLAHAELDLGAEVQESDPKKYAGYLQSRPPQWEDAAIALLIELCRETGCHVHIVHLSAASSLSRIAAAKRAGLPLSVETCPHYLCLQAEDIPDGATLFKCAPPIRGRNNRDALWQGLLRGSIDFVVTDHSPCTPVLKAHERGHFHEAWGGIASLQLGLPLLWTEAQPRGVSLQQLARWTSERPAGFAGLGHLKGRIAPGYDADLVVWNPDAEWTLQADKLFFRHRSQSPYLGRKLFGQVSRTLLRGRTIFEAGRHSGEPAGRVLLGRAADTAVG